MTYGDLLPGDMVIYRKFDRIELTWFVLEVNLKREVIWLSTDYVMNYSTIVKSGMSHLDIIGAPGYEVFLTPRCRV